MENIEFNAYLTDVFRFARTMVVKIESLALHDNMVLRSHNFEVGLDKSTWRYYMNLNGDYHVTDEIMTIESIDTGEIIEFTKQNLLTHISTFKEYSRGGYEFNRLVERYQGQADLIRGILAPIPYSVTIEAEDYKILKYNDSLVLWNEDQLIPKLQSTINSIVPQLFSHEYRYTDDLFLGFNVGLLTACIIEAICVIRHEAIGERTAHDFYIWSHIDSFGDFSKYKASLSNYQIMWLYRNIAWIVNNPGAQYTFDLLKENLLTRGGIPLARYDMIASTESQVEDLTPTPLYRRLQINLLEDYGRAASFIDTKKMITKQTPMAKSNYEESNIWYDDALKKGTFSLHSELPTKVLESSMTDSTNRHADTKMSVVFNNWIYLTAKGFYKGRILVTDPKTGRQTRLAVGDAFYIWQHLIDTAMGTPKRFICPAYYQNVLRVKPPSIDQLIALGGKEYIDEPLARGIRNHWTSVSVFISPEYLMDYSDEVYRIMWNHKKQYAQFYDLNKRARVQNTVGLMYESGFSTITDAKKYDELLVRYEMNFIDYTPEECNNFAWEIFKRVTGWDTNQSPSLRIKQNALIDIMMRLSSYTIHTIREMDDGNDVTELINEMFIGDSRLTGSGNGSYGDYTNVAMHVPTDMEGIRHTESLTELPPDVSVWPTERYIEYAADIVSHDHFIPVDLSTDLADYAVRIPDESYFAVVEGVWPPVKEEVPPPTYYGVLIYPDWKDQVIPPTFYGKLKYAETDQFRGAVVLKGNSVTFPGFGILTKPEDV